MNGVSPVIHSNSLQQGYSSPLLAMRATGRRMTEWHTFCSKKVWPSYDLNSVAFWLARIVRSAQLLMLAINFTKASGEMLSFTAFLNSGRWHKSELRWTFVVKKKMLVKHCICQTTSAWKSGCLRTHARWSHSCLQPVEAWGAHCNSALWFLWFCVSRKIGVCEPAHA